MTAVRTNTVEGLFYTSNPGELEKQVKIYIAESKRVADHPVKLIITPHAGYTYSGSVAGAAFAEIDGDSFNHVILMGPSHRHYFKGIAESTEDAWQTPLGRIEIAHLNSRHVKQNATYHSKEHCLEVQLPFIRHLMPHARLSPLLLSGDRSNAETIADQLIKFDTRQTLWVISSDFNHTGPSFQYIPRDVGYDSGKSMDMEAIQLITAGDISGFMSFLERTQSTICGALPILVAMHLVQIMGRNTFQFKEYDCSGDQTGDINSVGYGALYS